MSKQVTEKMSIKLMLCVLSAYIVQALLNGVSPVLATLAAEYPDVPMTSIYLLATIISLCSIPTNIGVGWFVNKLGYKGTSIFGIAMILIGGIMPYFLPAFNMLLVSRVLMGLGYGLCFPLGALLATVYFPNEIQRGKIMGWGSIVNSVACVCFSSGVGHLAAMNPSYIWFINLIMVIPLIFAFVMPPVKAPAAEKKTEVVDEEEVAPIGKEKISVTTWLFILCYALLLVFTYPFFLNISSVIINDNMGSAVQAGYVTTMFTAGGLVSGLIFGHLFAKFSGRVVTIGGICCLIGAVAWAFSKSMMLFYVTSFIAGIGFTMLMVFVYMGVSMTAPPTRQAFVIGVNVAGQNIGTFLAGYIAVWLAQLFGQSANLRFPFYAMLVFYGVGTILLTLKPIKFGNK